MRISPTAGPLILLGIGLVLLGTGVVLMLLELSFGRRAAKAQGTIVGVLLPRGKTTSLKARIPVVEFTASGRTIRFPGALESVDWEEKIGQPIGILYDPADPDRASLDDWAARYSRCAAWMLIGAAVLAAGVVMGFRILRQ